MRVGINNKYIVKEVLFNNKYIVNKELNNEN